MVSDRAYLANARIGEGLSAVETEVSRVLSSFPKTAQRIEPAALLSADLLIDLYGEEIRARAYTTNDPVEGELMLRPDFTVPVVQMFAQSSQQRAEYIYSGPVWRRQIPGSHRPKEYLQVGYESFGEVDEPQAEARIFATFSKVFLGLPVQPITGDVGLLFSAIDALDTTERRKAALRRHVWRPVRFERLLRRFSTPDSQTETRRELLLAVKSGNVEKLFDKLPEPVSLRSISEIKERVDILNIEAETPRLTETECAKINTISSLKTTVANAASSLKKIAPELEKSIENLSDRADAMADEGLDPAMVPFDASYGLTTMEYYDGFVFGFRAQNRPDLPQLAQGGRYDALTAILGATSPAIGGIVRPEALLALKGGEV